MKESNSKYSLLSVIKENTPLKLTQLEKYLYKDEVGDIFLITKNAEIYLYRGYKKETQKVAEFGLYIWGVSFINKLREMKLLSHEMDSDEEFYIAFTSVKNLPTILSLQRAFKHRPDLHGTFISNLEYRLGHKIIPFNPDLEVV